MYTYCPPLGTTIKSGWALYCTIGGGETGATTTGGGAGTPTLISTLTPAHADRIKNKLKNKTVETKRFIICSSLLIRLVSSILRLLIPPRAPRYESVFKILSYTLQHGKV